MNTQRRAALILVVLALVATACRRPDASVELGIQRIALNLSFSEEELKVPIEPEVIIKLIPAPPEVFEQPAQIVQFETPVAAPPPPPPPPRPPCPDAEPGSAPRDAVALQVSLPPTEGVYGRFNGGFIIVTGGILNLTLPYPLFSTWTVNHAEDYVTAGVEGFTEDTFEKTFTIRRDIAPGFATTDHFRISGIDLKLMKRVTEASGVITEFVPTPHIDFYVGGNEGDTWTSAGVDTATRTAMYVSGAIVQREIIDACGDLVDTYQYTLEEQLVNLDTGETSGTPAGEPNTYNIATQLGGLLVREDVHFTQTTSTEDGTPVAIEYDFVGLANGIEPEPLP